MSTRYPDAPHNDFIETIVDLGLAEHSDMTNTLSFFNEEKRNELINITIDALRTSSDLSSIDSKGKMDWVFQTLADAFCYGSMERNISRVRELYRKCLD